MAYKLGIIIPSYNEAAVLAGTIRELKIVLGKLPQTSKIIVVDDGSTDDSFNIASTFADVVLHHRRNCGLGAALATGIEYARRHNYDGVITFDADGQHDPKDIINAANLLSLGNDVVVGSRFLSSSSNMPFLRRLILQLSNLVTYLFFGVWTTDSQSGFRGLSRDAIHTITIKSNRMEVSSEFFGEIRRLGLKYCEFPIHVRYTKYSLSKGQKNTASFGVLLKLLYLIGR